MKDRSEAREMSFKDEKKNEEGRACDWCKGEFDGKELIDCPVYGEVVCRECEEDCSDCLETLNHKLCET